MGKGKFATENANHLNTLMEDAAKVVNNAGCSIKK